MAGVSGHNKGCDGTIWVSLVESYVFQLGRQARQSSRHWQLLPRGKQIERAFTRRLAQFFPA